MTKAYEELHKIDIIKYFVPLPEGDYDFQEHLTDYLLTDILNANKQLEKYESRVKELEKYLQEVFETLKIDNTGIFGSNSLEYYATRITTAKNKIKELDEIATKLNTRVEQQTEEKYNLNMDILKLECKLKIAERTLKNITTFEDNIITREDARETLQKMEEVK